MDKISKEKRSKIMSCIRCKNTKPEIIVRKQIWNKGYRFRIHDRSIQGKPDISNKKKKIAIFVDGCFWHGCPKCYKEPRSNTEFWRTKIQNNKNRRKTVKKSLQKDGWSVLEIWEHQIHRNPDQKMEKILDAFETN